MAGGRGVTSRTECRCLHDQPFHHATFGDIRVQDQNGEPWYIAKDVCDALDIVNVSHAMNGLDPDEYATINISDGNTISKVDSIPLERRGNPNVLIIKDSGLSTLAFRSNKPEAKRFRKWVTREVLPAIRKTGAYMTDQFIENALSDPDGTIRLIQEVKVADEDHLKRRCLRAVLMQQTAWRRGTLAIGQPTRATGQRQDWRVQTVGRSRRKRGGSYWIRCSCNT